MFRSVGAIALMSFAGTALAQTAPVPVKDARAINTIVNAVLPDDQAAMKAHVMFLASDAMRGREAGSPEFDIAAEYVAAQFYAAGLRPAGDDGGYLQKVPLVTYRAADKGDGAVPGQWVGVRVVYLRDIEAAGIALFPDAVGEKARVVEPSEPVDVLILVVGENSQLQGGEVADQ